MDDIQAKIISGKITALEVGWQSRAFHPRDVIRNASNLLEEKGIPETLVERLKRLIAIASDDDRIKNLNPDI